MRQVVSASLTDGLAALLRGEAVPWTALDTEPSDVLDTCITEDLTGLVHRHLARRPANDWPGPIWYELEREARAAVMHEALRRRELTAALDSLAAAGIRPILIKGTPLAYTVYEEPSLRRRSDTDLVIRWSEREQVQSVLGQIGYALTNSCESLFNQFELAKDDAFGLTHALDFHWKISSQSAFADLLGYDDLAAGAEPVPALGPHALAAGPVPALLLACIHPVMHHRNAERLIWLYDIHLLASRLSSAELDAFSDLAARKGVATVCARELELAHSRLGTPVPARVVAALAAPGPTAEATAAYLEPGRRWQDELAANVRGLPHRRDRLRLLRELAFPAPGYMLRAYGLEASALSGALLPALYMYRGLRGLWKLLRGQK